MPAGWFTYIVRTSRGHLYCGVSQDVARRIRQHNGELAGGAKALRGQRPVVLEWVSKLPDTRSAAQKLECGIKQLSHKQKEAFVQDPQLFGIRGVH